MELRAEMKRVHITNGDVFNKWLKSRVQEPCVPFNEAMMSHTVCHEPFTEQFITHRAYHHGVTVQNYRENLKEFFEVMNDLKNIDELVLWFGMDAFCQMNLLTILTALELKNYTGKVKTVLFDENKDWNLVLCIQKVQRKLQGYVNIYNHVLVWRRSILCDDEFMNQGIHFFLDYHSQDGKLSRIVDEHPQMNEYDLIVLLLKKSEEYGLSDLQAKELIQKRRNKMKRALFVIDYQNDFVDGALGFAGAEKLDARIVSKIREYGEGNVWFTRDTHFENYLETREGKNLPVIHCVKGTHGWDIYGETKKALEEVHAKGIDKLVFGMDVTDPDTAAVLPESLDEIELVGLVSNICVVSNAVVLQSKYPEATIIVDAQCTDSFDKELHEKVLDVLSGFQVKVIHR